jgi:hypothetical protein
MNNTYKSKRKNKSWLNPEIHDLIGDYIAYGKPKDNMWYTSGEVCDILRSKGLPEMNSGEVGAYLTAAGFVKKRFGEAKLRVDGYEDNDFNWKLVNKWRINFIK